MAIDIKKFIPKFQEESRELIKMMSDGMMKMESGDYNSETLDEIFRCAHKIKGNSRMLNLPGINELAHNLEDVLDVIRSGKIHVDSILIDLLIQSSDILEALVEKALDAPEEARAKSEIIDLLKAAAIGEKISLENLSDEKKNEQNAGAAASSGEKPDEPPSKKTLSEKIETVRVKSSQLDGQIRTIGEIANHQNKLRYIIQNIKEISDSMEKSRAQIGSDNFSAESFRELVQSLEIKLKTVTKSAVEEMSLLDIVTNELQDSALNLRMLPLDIIFDNLPRSVRDIARDLGKTVHLKISGQHTEIDKKIIEVIGDPILHIIRNAVDHGIESPEERRRIGKPETAVISVDASYEGGSVVISISDDGTGISKDKVLEKARKKGILEPGKDSISDSDILQLIFSPGFSTAQIITDISGRGVGLDIVKSAIDGIKGNVQVITKEGRGTTFRLKMPLSLATLTVLFVKADGELYGLPINYLSEMLKVNSRDIIEAAGRKTLRLRDQLVPIAELGSLLGKSPDRHDENGMVYIVVTSVDNNLLGIIVDDLISQDEFVIKPLPKNLQNNRMVTGVIITEKNETACILHLPEIVRNASITGRTASVLPKKEIQRKRILVADDSVNTREIEKNILEAAGYIVELAIDGNDAMDKVEREKYDLIVTDVDMPGMDGFSLTRKIRSTENYRHLPVVIVTSREREEDKKRGIEVGANAYIIKGGFNQNSLLDIIGNLI